MMAMSRSQGRKYYYHTVKHDAVFETPKDSIASYVYVDLLLLSDHYQCFNGFIISVFQMLNTVWIKRVKCS